MERCDVLRWLCELLVELLGQWIPDKGLVRAEHGGKPPSSNPWTQHIPLLHKSLPDPTKPSWAARGPTALGRDRVDKNSCSRKNPSRSSGVNTNVHGGFRQRFRALILKALIVWAWKRNCITEAYNHKPLGLNV